MAETSIEWTDATWNPTVGCSRVSPGCERCYAERMAYRLARMGQKRYAGLTRKTANGQIQWTGVVRFVPDVLRKPLTWKQPKRIFVDSMSDLFHEQVTTEQIAAVWATMILAHWHTFQVLTKRAERMHQVLTDPGFYRMVLDAADRLRGDDPAQTAIGISDPTRLPPHNVELYVSVENQATANERIPFLVSCPAAVHGVSMEPMLGRIDLSVEYFTAKLGRYPFPQLDQQHRTRLIDVLDVVIIGGESGHRARDFNVPDAQLVVDQCKAAGKKVFFKQMGARPMDCNDAGFEGGPGEWPAGTTVENWERDPSKRHQGALIRIRLKNKKGNKPEEWPEGLRVRELPGVA